MREEKKRARFENTMGIPFLTLLNIGQNAPKKNLNSNYIVLNEKNSFRFDFGPRKAPQPEKCIFTFMHFPVWHFPGSKIESESIFFIKYYINTIL